MWNDYVVYMRMWNGRISVLDLTQQIYMAGHICIIRMYSPMITSTDMYIYDII